MGRRRGGGTDFGAGLEVSTDGGTSWNNASSATIAAGATSVLVRTPVVNDALDEAAETFTLTATRTAGTTTNASASGTATITDDDAAPAVSINDVTVNEAAGTATFTVTLNAASGQTVSVNHATSDGTATAGADYTSTSGTATFTPGATTQTFTVPILNDPTFESSEAFNVTLSGAVNATIADNTGVGTIRDDGTGAGGTNNDTPTMSVSSPAVTEGTNAFAVFTVSLSNASTTAVAVNLALANGTATGGGTDFGAGLEVSTDGGTSWNNASSATIAAGATSVLVRTPVVNDALDEAAETFTLTATRTAGTTTNASASGTATITDDDAAPAVSINDVTVNEAAGTATFTVTLNAASGQTVSVNHATSDGTATAGADYTSTSGTVTFTPGATTQTFTVPILNDPTFEQSESFNVTLSGAVNATIADNTGVGTIRDDGTGAGGTNNDTPTMSVSSPTVTEGTEGFVVFTVGLSNASTTAVAVNLALANGTATGGGTDFGSGGAGNLQVSTDGGATWADASSATIAAGATSVLVRTPVVNDALDEAVETFSLTATRTAGTTTNASASGTATITDEDPAPLATIDDVTVNEVAGTATFTVTLNAASGQSVNVNYATTGGSATAGVDFSSSAGTVNFAAGATTQTITVPILNDAIFENSESFNVILSGAVNATIADNMGIGTIRDDGSGSGGTDNDRPALTVSNVSVTEGPSAFAVFAVGLSNPSTTAVAVNLALANGTATGGGTDFGGGLEVSTDNGATWSAASSATIAAGATSVLVRTPVTDDSLSEGAETFTLTATRSAGATTNLTAAGTATIADNDGLPALSIDDLTVNEGAGTATFTVTLGAPSGQNVSVNYSTANGSALAGADYSAVSGTLNFTPGELTRTITVPIANDTIYEGSETFAVTLSGAVNAVIADGTAAGTIRDDGAGTGGGDNDTPSLSITNPTVTEGAAAYVEFTISLSNASTAPVDLGLALANGTATGGGVDFGAGLEVSTDGGSNWTPAATATIAAGSTSVLVRTPIVNDGTSETTENFTLTATRTAGATTNASVVGTGTIQDNDPAGAFSIDDVTVNEGAGTATFTVTLSSPSALTTTVNYATTAGTALGGADFAVTGGGLTFAPGVTSRTVTVPILNDAIFEGSETFNVVLSGAANASISDGTGLGTINDDGTGANGSDNDAPTLTVGDVAVTEGTDAYAVFTVALSNVSTTPVTASLALTNGSATGGGTDFGAGLEVSLNGGGTWTPAGSVTIPAGATSALVRTPITNDALNEAAETFTLTATRTAGTTTNASALGTATITDNDSLPALTINDLTVNEAVGTATFTVTLSTSSGQVITVDYATSDGTAMAGTDYTAAAGTVTFAAGTTSQTLTVPITNDTPYEGAETFNVLLSNATNAVITDALGLGTIRDDGGGSGGTNDDRPVSTLPATFAGTEDTSLALGGISVFGSDLAAVVTVTFSVPSGGLNLSTVVAGGVTAGDVTGNGGGTVTITARMDAINTTLADAAGFSFNPAADFHGPVLFTMNTVNGLGTDTDTSTITVAPVADIANDTDFTTEDTPVTIGVLGNDSFEDAGRTITAVDGNAITAGGPAVAVSTGTVALDAFGQLTYTPNSNYHGPASFSYTVSSGGATETATVTITVNPVNDALAVSNPTSAAAIEDTSYVFSSANGNALTIDDVDGGQLEVTLSVAHGTLTLGSLANLTFTTGDGTADTAMTFRGTAVDLTAAMDDLTFTPTADYNGPAALNYTIRDVGTPVATLINGGFEQPGGVAGFPNQYVQVDQASVDGWDTSAGDGLIEIWANGKDGVPSFEGGQFAEINATQSSTLSQVITVPAASALTYSFAHRGRAGVDVMNATITDLGLDGALGGGDDTIILNEDFADGNTAWGAYTRNLGIATGNLLLLEFTSISTAGGSPSAGNFVDGVSLIAEQFIPKTIAINVAPVADIADDSAIANEDTPVTIAVLGNDNFEDPAAVVTAVDGQAVVANGAAVAVANGTVALNGANQLIFTPTLDFNGLTAFTYTVTSGTVTETANVNVTVAALNDSPVLDLDTTTGGTGYVTTFIENGGAVPIIGANVSATDLDSATLASARVVLSNAQAGDSLAIFSSLPPGIIGSIDTSVAGQITVNLSGAATPAAYQSALQKIQFSNGSENPATVARALSVTVNDGVLDANVAVSTVAVVAVNDAPGVTVPGVQSVTPGTAHAIPGVSFSDVDVAGGNVIVTLSVTGGNLTVASAVAGGVTALQIAGNGSGTVTLTAPLAVINTTLADLAGLIFQTNTSGAYTLTAAINDNGNSGVDPSTLSLPATGTASDERASASLALTVAPPAVSISNESVTEGTDPHAVFAVILSNPSSTAVVLDLALGAGTALGGGVDFGSALEVSTDGGATWNPATTATIAAGGTSVLVRTPITDDALDEAAETFTLAGSVTSGNTSNSSATGVATITDDDAAPLLTINDVTVNEAAGTATFTVTLNAISGQSVTVNYATSNGTALAGADYSAASGTLNFAAGTTTRTITVPILNDTVFEGSETFNVELSGAVNATISDALGLGTIRDDGAGTGGGDNDTPGLSVSNVTVAEGVDTHAVFAVSLSNLSTTNVSVDLALTDGTATGAGIDFGASLEVSTDGGANWVGAVSATIAAGTTSVLVRTPLTDDLTSETSEIFSLTATVSAGATTTPSATGVATITDNDTLPTLSINDVTVNEAAGTATFTVTLNAVSGQTVGVLYTTNSGTAVGGADFTAGSGGLTFAPGVTTQTLTVPITNDAIFEGSESFTVTLAGASKATIADATGIGTILDDGTGFGGTNNDTPILSVSSVALTEGTDPYGVFTLNLSNPSATAVSVALSLGDGTATGGGIDFGAGLEVSTDGGGTWTPAATATFAPGSTSVLVRTPITDDVLNESAENFTLSATVTSGSTVNLSTSGTGSIADNDGPPAFAINDVVVNEAAGTATFTVTLSSASGQAVAVDYATSNGTATAGADFSASTGTLTFAAGEVSKTVTVPILDDTVFENNESFFVLLSAGVNAGIADDTGLGTIRDDGTGTGGADNDTPTLSVTNVAVTEGTDGFATFVVALSNLSTAAVDLGLVLADAAATGGGIDFGAGIEVSTDGGTTWTAAATATIAAGRASVLVRTPITDDPLDEVAEDFTLTATVTGGLTTNPIATGTATIADDDALPTLSIDNVTVNEAAGTATFTVTLSTASGLPVSVSYGTSGGTATAGGDFTSASGTLTFLPGSTSETITISIANDALFEQNESYNVLLSAPVNATIADGTGLGTILDDGTGTGGTDDDTPTLSVANVSVTEGLDAHAVLAVTLSNASTTPVGVALMLANGSATGGGTDFGAGLEVSTDGGATWLAAAGATFAPGSTSVLVRTPITDDALDEGVENFTLTATVAAGVTTNGVATGTATITDDDATPSLTIDDVTVNEAAGTATFTVTLSAVSDLPVSVDYTTNSGTAVAGLDFSSASGTLIFAPGETSRTITVPILNDSIFEQSESLTVNLSGEVNAIIANAVGLGTILDDDRPALTLSNVSATEGADPYAVFLLNLSNASTTPVSVNLALTDGSAVGGGVDFGGGLEVSTDGGSTWTPGSTATFAPGMTSLQVRTPVTDDTLDELLENFTLTATVTAGTTSTPNASGLATIADDDGTPVLSIADVTVNEAAGTATFTVTLSAASGLPVSVDYATSNGTATGGTDLTATTGTLIFAPGDTSRTITVAITDDVIFEVSETFDVLLSAPVNATIADGTGTGTILDDGTGTGGTDNDTPVLSVGNLTVVEGTNAHAVFTLSLSNPAIAPVSVNLALADVSATGGGGDYGAGLEVSTDGGTTWIPGATAVISPSTTSVLVRTPIANDASPEPAETFTLAATVTAGTTTNGSAIGTATIFDDDAPSTLSIDDLTINEAAGTATFTVTLNTPSGLPISVNYGTADGSAFAGRDYLSTSGTLNFAAGETSKTVTVAILNDVLFENRESLAVILSGAVNATIADASGAASILDDDLRRADLSLFGTSEVATVAASVVVGEVVTYELRLELAEGANGGTTLWSALPAGLRFLPGAPVVVGYANVDSSVTGFAAGSYTNATADTLISASLTANDDLFADGTPVYFKLGALTNNDTDADREFVTVRFDAVVTNSLPNQAGVLRDLRFAPLIDLDGDGLSGFVSIDRDGDNVAIGTEVANDPLNDASGIESVSADITTDVAEPILVLDKQITSAPGVIRVGESITYTLTISHAVGSGGTAWEATLSDVLPPGLLFSQIDSVTLAGGAQQQVPAAFGGAGLSLGGVWDIPVGGSVTIVYRAQATLDAVLGSTLTSLADLTWSSLDGTSADERRSGDGLLGSGGLDDYALEQTASATVDSGAGDFSLDKQVLGDSSAEIGERLTYRLTLNVADGIINSVSLNDLIPAGFALVNGSAKLAIGSGVTVSGASFTYASNQLTLDIAQLQSADDGLGNTVTITYDVDVLDAAANDAFGGAGAATKTNLAAASYDPGSGPITANDSVTVNIVEPVIVATETVTSAPVKPNAGDTVSFQVVIGHGAGSTGNAYNVVYTDTLPAEFGNLQLTGVSGTAGVLPALGDFTLFGNTILTVNPFDLALGEQVVLTYTAVIQDTVTPGAVLTNNALVSAQSTDASPSGSARTAASGPNSAGYEEATGATLTADATFDLAKIANVSTATIGDRVRYTITVTVIEGTTPALVLSDALPIGPAFDPGSLQITYGAPGMNSSNATPASVAGNTLTLDFATLTNPGDNDAANDTITIEYDEVVSDHASNQNGDVKTNLVSGTYTGLSSPRTASAAVTLVEPVLTVGKTVDDATPHLGQTVTYTIVVSHDGASMAEAFDLTLADPLPPGVSLNAASIQLVSPSVGTMIVANTSTDGGALQLGLNRLALGESVTITFTATVTTDPAAIGGTFGGGDDTLTSTAVLGYDTQAGANPEQRESTDAVAATLTVVGGDLAVALDDGETDVNAGDQLTYTIAVTNNGTDTATNVVVSDTLPPGAVFNAALSTPGATLVAGRVVFGIPALAAGATEIFTVVVDLADPTAGGVESVTSVVDVTHDDLDPTPLDNTASDTDTLRSAPDYQITVTNNRSSAKPGETVDYVITVRNAGTQDGTGVIVSDFFSTDIFSALVADHGGVVDLLNGTVSWNVGDLAAGDRITLTLRGTVRATFATIDVPVGTVPGTVPDNDAIAHALEVTDDGLGGSDLDASDNTAADLDDLQPVPELKITATDHVTTAKPGQTLTYTIVATNAGAQGSSGMVVTDMLPRGVTLLGVSSSDPTLSGAPVVAGRSITWTIAGSVAAGESITFTVVVRVNEDVVAGSKLVNRAAISDDGIYGPDAVTMSDNAASDTDQVPAAPPAPTRPTPEPAAPPLPVPFVFAFDTFHNFAAETLRERGELARTAPIDLAPAAILPLVPIYSGEADPGATLVIALYNARGERIGSQTVVADSGGNWLATFPSTNPRDIPNSVEITALPAPYSVGESTGRNLRNYFSPALNPGNFVLQSIGGRLCGDEAAPLLGGLGLENPLQLGAVKYGGELLGTPATAAGY